MKRKHKIPVVTVAGHSVVSYGSVRNDGCIRSKCSWCGQRFQFLLGSIESLDQDRRIGYVKQQIRELYKKPCG